MRISGTEILVRHQQHMTRTNDMHSYLSLPKLMLLMAVLCFLFGSHCHRASLVSTSHFAAQPFAKFASALSSFSSAFVHLQDAWS